MDSNDLFITSQAYDEGINDDPFAIWREDDSGDSEYSVGSIGYVHLAFRIIVEALYDLICGTHDQMLSASIFFFGDMYTLDDLRDMERELYNEERSDPSDTMAGVEWSTGSLYPVWATILGMDENTLPELAIRHRKGIISQDDVDDLRKLYTVMVTGKMGKLK
jgi:hypothetical protein